MERMRVRFAPSPTGYLHIGGARTALFNWLFARGRGGTFILRIEDTDITRSSEESERAILEALRWLGLNWDEGPDKSGDYGPYRQSERLNIYQDYAHRLLKKGYAYYCYCTPEELEERRRALLKRGVMPKYDGRCRDLTIEKRKSYEKEGRKPSLRFKVTEGVVVDDLIRGKVEFSPAVLGDFIILRSDGRPPYNFAVVIDDMLMRITHVIRGEDHLSNTPRQILIYRALEYSLPYFAHVPLLLGPDRTKLSKRHGETSVIQYRELGYLPEAMINYLALLGWSAESGREILSREELIKEFSLERVSKNPAIFDQKKLAWINSHYLKKLDLESFTHLALPYLKSAGYLDQEIDPERFEWLKRVVEVIRSHLNYLAQIPGEVSFFFKEEVEIAPEGREVLKGEKSKAVLEAALAGLKEIDYNSADSFQHWIKSIEAKTGMKGGSLYMPIRVALTGTTHGPELYRLFPLLGEERCEKRLSQALEEIESTATLGGES